MDPKNVQADVQAKQRVGHEETNDKTLEKNILHRNEYKMYWKLMSKLDGGR